MKRALAPVGLLLLAACSGGSDDAQPAPTDIPKAVADQAAAPVVESEYGTPVKDRVATIGLLNKRNNLTQDLVMKPGESRRVGNVIVRLASCERTLPWESPPETGAFVQLTVQDQRDDKWYRVFSGWVFKERPERNVIQHPIYDVFVKSCAMTYPGGEPVARSAPKTASAPKASSADQSPAGNGGEGTPAPAAPAAAPKAASPAPDSTE